MQTYIVRANLAHSTHYTVNTKSVIDVQCSALDRKIYTTPRCEAPSGGIQSDRESVHLPLLYTFRLILTCDLIKSAYE